MAINKVVNKSTKSHGAMRNVLEYVLRDEKVKEGYVHITGPYNYETINWDNVYKAFLDEKKLWDKDSGRMYAHNIISFHKDELISPEQCLEIGRKFTDKFFEGYQCVICVHQDKDHTHCHIVTNTVSYIDGKKLHQTKRDLEYQKKITNQLCMEHGLTIAEKGKHFDGTAIEEGEIIAWSKDKYNLLQNVTKKSFVAECAIAVLEAREQCSSKEEFIERMKKKGWHTSWSDNQKHITFQNDNGNKVRDSNLSKSFSLNISKEALLNEFERQNEILKLAMLKSNRDRVVERERTEQLDRYYAEVEASIQGNGVAGETIGSIKASHSTEGHTFKGRETGGQAENTDYLIRDIKSEIADNRSKNRTIRNTEDQSIALEKQSQTREAERRSEEQQWIATKERTRETKRQSYYRSEPER